MKDTKNVNVPVFLHQVGDAVMPVEQDADVARSCRVPGTELRKSPQILGSIVDAFDRSGSGLWIVSRDVLKNVVKPALSFFGPPYLCHDRMRRPISSFEIVRLASESEIPRSTITWKASSRTISSRELSSGWPWIRRVSSSLAVDMTNISNLANSASETRCRLMTPNAGAHRRRVSEASEGTPARSADASGGAPG